MESISLETDWDRLGLSALGPTGRNNFSSSFISELNSFNTSHSGGSFFGIFPENGSNSTPRTLPQPRVRDIGLARAEIAVLAVVLALTTLGNSFVLWVLLRRRKHNAPMHIFMVNLCVADLVVAFFQVSTGVSLRHYSNMNIHRSQQWMKQTFKKWSQFVKGLFCFVFAISKTCLFLFESLFKSKYFIFTNNFCHTENLLILILLFIFHGNFFFT